MVGLGGAQVVTIQSDNAGYPIGVHVAPGLLASMNLAPLVLSVAFREDLVPGWSSASTLLLGAGVRL
jgi:hypothetical protein